MRGAIDEDHLSLALSHGRVILTQDADFLFADTSETEYGGRVGDLPGQIGHGTSTILFLKA